MPVKCRVAAGTETCADGSDVATALPFVGQRLTPMDGSGGLRRQLAPRAWHACCFLRKIRLYEARESGMGIADTLQGGMSGDAASKVTEASEFLRRVCIANSHVGVYSIQHPVAAGAIQSAFAWVADVLGRTNATIDINLADDGSVFVRDLPVESRNPLVAQFVRKLNDMHANTLVFAPGLTRGEFDAFFRVLAMRPADVAAQGGVAAILVAQHVTHITMSRASYVMVNEDQRVVSRSDQVVSTDLPEGAANEDLLRYVVSHVIAESHDKEWFLTRLKNNPEEAARTIAETMERALTATDDRGSDQERMDALLQNIRLVAGALMDDSGTVREGHEDLEEAILALETEIRARSQHMTSAGESARFIRELLGVVSSYSDEVKAYRIKREFLKDEASLKKTEKLLRGFTSRGAKPEDMLQRLKGHLIRYGLKEDDVTAMIEGLKTRERPKRKKTFDQALQDGINQRVRKLAGAGEHEEVVNELTTFFENKLREKDQDFKAERDGFAAAAGRVDTVLDEVQIGVMVWDASGAVEHTNAMCRRILGIKEVAGLQLRPELIEDLKTEVFPLQPEAIEALLQVDLTPLEFRLLSSVYTIVRSADGQPVGAILAAPNRPTA